MTDRRFMRRAIELATAGIGSVSPNPAVGAVLVREGRIIGEGYHREYGGPHAETDCIRDAQVRGEDPQGAVMYCTLEPCSFRSPTKHNPPCTEKVMEAGITRMIIAARDPNPAVAGCGVQALRAAGIQTCCGLMEEQVLKLNESYFLSTALRRPQVHLKWAQSLNGRIAHAGGGKTPISGPEALRHSHGLRATVDAILVGRGTVELDDPGLTARYGATPLKQPLRVVLDPSLRTPISSQLFQDKAADTLVFSGALNDDALNHAAELKQLGVELVQLPVQDAGGFNVSDILDALYERGVRSVLVEGGAVTHTAFLAAGLWDRLTVYIGPTMLEGKVIAPDAPGYANVVVEHEVDVLGDTVALTSMNPNTRQVLNGLKWDTAPQPQKAGCTLPQEEPHVHRLST
ncbi:MAG: bifunctional diaminohydroxyphosphoribosylaminopyrimidine deaminase/5-amino-6-(5-phosphoribosylamino)uracil reductase RibD [Spirochaeta sp.]|nr:bifunctional diaminohydroxyphosphoribosylaminopyrimidine deaminase/5-amino-6-(5-phosphoribosylamino)uracil reductase RibD [Spirochaeta sp.]